MRVMPKIKTTIRRNHWVPKTSGWLKAGLMALFDAEMSRIVWCNPRILVSFMVVNLTSSIWSLKITIPKILSYIPQRGTIEEITARVWPNLHILSSGWLPAMRMKTILAVPKKGQQWATISYQGSAQGLDQDIPEKYQHMEHSPPILWNLLFHRVF